MLRTVRRSLEPLENRLMLSVTVSELEVNDNSDDANTFALASDGRATLVGTISDVDDRDYFIFSPTGDLTSTLQFSLTSPSGVRPRLEIQDADGETIGETDPVHGIHSGSVAVTLGAMYYVRMDDTANSYTANLTVSPVVHAVTDVGATVEDAAAITINVLANDFGMNGGDVPTLVSVSGAGSHGSVSIAPGGSAVRYSVGAFPGLEVGRTATDSFSYTIAYAGGTVQQTGTVNVTVTGVNHSPVAANDVWSLTEDSGYAVVPVLNNDADPDAGDTKRVVSVQSNLGFGSVQVAANGAGVLFLPNGSCQSMAVGQSQFGTIDYTMADAAGELSSATLELTLNGANDAPVAMHNVATISEDDVSYFLDVLPDDSDIDVGDSKTVVSLDGSATPGNFYITFCVCAGSACFGYWVPGTPAVQGAISIAPGGSGILYTPPASFQSLNAGQTVIEVFRYTMSDEHGGQSTATMMVTVEGRNETPVLSRGNITTTPLATRNTGSGGTGGSSNLNSQNVIWAPVPTLTPIAVPVQRAAVDLPTDIIAAPSSSRSLLRGALPANDVRLNAVDSLFEGFEAGETLRPVELAWLSA